MIVLDMTLKLMQFLEVRLHFILNFLIGIVQMHEVLSTTEPAKPLISVCGFVRL